MSSAALRPGGAIGAYPEREAISEHAIDGAARSALRALAHRSRFGEIRLRRFTGQVEAHARTLDGASAARLEAELSDLRAALRTGGFEDTLVARTFALVREVAGRELGMRHFESQLIGGFVLMNGLLAEMETGEGKTLTATLPACTAALAGVPVHIVTVNDYLVERDAELMGPLYEALGLRVGALTEAMASPDARREAYGCDVTYCTNKQLAFDYLRDRLTLRNRRGRLSVALDPRASQLLLRGLCFAIVDEADSVLIDEARTPLLISREVAPDAQREIYPRALELARALEARVDFRVDPHERRVELAARGRERVEQLTSSLGGPWRGRRRREEWVQQALCALHLFTRDEDYLVRDGKVQIIDAHTGRVMPDRAWERALHQMVEVKEGCEISGERETLARITYQRFFRRYLRLAGMTGTAREVAGELRAVYDLAVVTVPTQRPVQRVLRGERIYASADARWSAVVGRVKQLHGRGCPVLVGTRSLAASEHLSRLLDQAGLSHQLLNARQDREEARIVACAGERGRITVATNMAGRGTDIRLSPGVAELGGLHVISTERNEARRIDRQLAGRCGRQGEPGNYEAMLSLEDDLVTRRFPRGLPPWLELSRRLVGRRWRDRILMSWLQMAVERQHRGLRRDLLRLDEQLSDALAFTGPPE